MFRLLILFSGFAWCAALPSDPPDGISFQFKGSPVSLRSGMRLGGSSFGQRGGYTNADLDTLSNWYNPAKQYVEIIRQDDPVRPGLGVALGFEFDDTNGDYPYTPAFARLQLKDFGWGGMEFSHRDTCNYTGVSNDVSDDLTIEIDGYAHDTIWGTFSGLLLSGAGPMTPIEHGQFRVKVYRMR